MKKLLIPWHVFRAALEGQDSEALEHWLDHWGFTNEGVALISVDTRLGLQVPPLERQQLRPDVVALNPRLSLHDLVEILSRDPLFAVEVTTAWSYHKEL